MHIALCRLLIAGLILAFAVSLPAGAPRQGARPLIVLVGDSTVTETDGWGLGFRQLALEPARIVDEAANGRSSKSFLDEGRWRDALALRGQYYLIQFGHNDEPGKGPDRETRAATTFRDNLRRYVAEARAIGAVPILITSLTRRQFDASGHIATSQGPYVEATRAVAREEGVALIDLNLSSVALSEHLGAEALASLSARTAAGAIDTTHLNAAGSLVFARLVVDGLTKAVPALRSAFTAVARTPGTGSS